MGGEKDLENYIFGGARAWQIIKYSGFYELDKLLNILKGVIEDYGYGLTIDEHTENVKTSGKEYKIVWTATKDVTEYVTYTIKMEIIILRQIDVLLEENGKQVRKQRGDMEIRFKASVKKNYRGPFKPTAFGNFLRYTYERYIVMKRLDSLKDKLRLETLEFMESARKALKTVG